MDDTLIETKKAKYKAHKHAAKKFYNYDLKDAELNALWGKPFPLLVEGLYGQFVPVEKAIENYYLIGHEFPIDAYQGALELLTTLSHTHLLGLVTAANGPLMISALGDAEIPISLFEYVQSSDDTPAHKPDPEVFAPSLEYFGRKGIKSEEILYVGDAISDLQAAHGAGIGFVGIAGHTTPKHKFEEVGGHYVESFPQLIDLVMS